VNGLFQYVILVIKGKGKFGYLSGVISTSPMDTTDYQTYQTWEAENSIVMSWLINSMEPKIGQTYLFYKIAKEVCKIVQEIYFDLENIAKYFEIWSTFRTT